MINELIEQGKKIAQLPYDAPTRKLWANRVEKYIAENYSQDYSDIWESTYHTRVHSMDRNKNHQDLVDRTEKALELLEHLKDEPVSQKTPVKPESPTTAVSSSGGRAYGGVTITGGTVVFGDGNQVTQVQIKDLVQALTEEIEEKVPESAEKRGILSSLKTLTENESFASVTGAVIGEVLKRITQ